jgi:hypothetical protein
MNHNKPIFYPIIDNGMGLSVTAWAVSMLGAMQGEGIFCHISTPYPSYAMDVATHHFLQSECDEMVLIDTDLIFTPQDLQHLLEHQGEPLVFGAYPKRKVQFDLPLVTLPDKPRPFDDPGPLCEVAKTARGFMRVHRSVFEKMKPHVPLVPGEFGEFHHFWPVAKDGTSEDFAFCAKWRELGGRILIDKRILVRHAGQVMYPIRLPVD